MKERKPVSAAPLAGGLEKTQGRRHMSTTLLMSWKKTQGRRDPPQSIYVTPATFWREIHDSPALRAPSSDRRNSPAVSPRRRRRPGEGGNAGRGGQAASFFPGKRFFHTKKIILGPNGTHAGVRSQHALYAFGPKIKKNVRSVPNQKKIETTWGLETRAGSTRQRVGCAS